MADGSGSGAGSQNYTSFHQFIAQNDFSQLNSASNQYGYYPSTTWNTNAREFYPTHQYQAPVAVAVTQSHAAAAPLPAINSLSIAGNTPQQNGGGGNVHATHAEHATSTTSGGGAIPKQQQFGRHGRNANQQSNPPPQQSLQNGDHSQGNRRQQHHNHRQQEQPYLPNEDHGQGNTRRQQQQQHNPPKRRNDRRRNNDQAPQSYPTWSNGPHEEEAQRQHQARPANQDRNRNNSRANNRGGNQNHQPASPLFRNGRAPPAVDKSRATAAGAPSADFKASGHPKPTDYQPNRNLRRPERVLDLPVDISQREKQIVEIDSGQLECLICCEKIRAQHSTWCCKNCYSILHLNCTNKWASRSKKEADSWRCPSCQNPVDKVPHDYYCFCGKEKNPQYNRNDLPHSCGELCGRKTSCDHPCTLLCHPGACPTCQASVTQACGCGSTSKQMICSMVTAITCEGLCEKTRNCGLHKCGKPCHSGECTPCDEVLIHTCHCGRGQREVACTVENLEEMKYACEDACDKELNCKNHKCLRKCHPDACSECDLIPATIRSCPCGKRPILAAERKSCLDEIPLCDSTCNKVLSCGAPSNPHRCVSKCHLGACPPCQKSTAVKCRCGQMDQMVKCRQLTTRADDARCKKKCTKKRSCGKHKCNVECCIDIDHICPLPCPSTLSCGKHKCERTCHPGHCLPCTRASFHELQCECGAQVIYPPVPCGTKKPVCDKPCTRAHVCDHAVLHNCHTGSVCPPCMIQTTKFCYGKHEQWRTIPCSQESFSCGMPCNKELPCGEHKCIRTCHEGECVQPGQICKQSCVKPRTICSHKCLAPCHTGACPETMCKETVEVVCQCGNRKQNRLCHDFANEFKRIATAQLASSLQDMQSSSGGLKEIFAPIKWTTAKKIECDDSCAILERNRRMAIGLQIRNPELSAKLQTKYSDYLMKWMKDDPRFIENIHNKLTELVKLAKESKKSRSFSFPVMNREKRHAVHEMCEVFGVESVAYDAEPQRNIVATAHKDRSWLPAQSIMEVAKREGGGGIRRVPGPAWGITARR